MNQKNAAASDAQIAAARHTDIRINSLTSQLYVPQIPQIIAAAETHITSKQRHFHRSKLAESLT